MYARGFLRTYSRYLGLNPDELVRVFPNGSLTVDIEPLPSVARPQAQLIDVNWVVAGLVMLFLLAAGLLLLRDQSDGTIVGEAPLQTAIAGASQSNGGQALVAPQTDLSAPVAGKPIGPIRPESVPRFCRRRHRQHPCGTARQPAELRDYRDAEFGGAAGHRHRPVAFRWRQRESGLVDHDRRIQGCVALSVSRAITLI